MIIFPIFFAIFKNVRKMLIWLWCVFDRNDITVLPTTYFLNFKIINFEKFEAKIKYQTSKTTVTFASCRFQGEMLIFQFFRNMWNLQENAHLWAFFEKYIEKFVKQSLFYFFEVKNNYGRGNNRNRSNLENC